ncbi:hypothetical protein LTR04_004491 [Oleoguttula sp. CCFEE 6159]|nr:hypothetical protein LTR04_004491 [Oleoguttula sp. CCFEE 6159]
MGLSEPTFSFTIPSIHDDTPLDCRLYHPKPVSRDGAPSAGSGQKRGAIVAHPYAPMGGSYDDPVVGIVAGQLLKEGFVVGTFNFRGAGTSKGRTSWTGKAEMEDYIAFAGFFVHYLHGLQDPAPPSPPEAATSALPPSPGASQPALSTIQSNASAPNLPSNAHTETIGLVLGGYSYGSLILTRLPPTHQIVLRFTTPPEGSAAAEILLRAHRLALQRNELAHAERPPRGRQLAPSDALRDPRLHPHSQSHSITVGGEETDATLRRPSRESRRSIDGIRRSFDALPRPRKSFKSLRRKSSDRDHDRDRDLTTSATTPSAAGSIAASTHYLLVSPLLPPVSLFATLFARPKRGPRGESDSEDKFAAHPTLAVYGDRDFFTAARKLRQWSARLAAAPGSRFRAREVQGAGHFWHEAGVEARLKEAVRGWAADVVLGREGRAAN